MKMKYYVVFMALYSLTAVVLQLQVSVYIDFSSLIRTIDISFSTLLFCAER